MREIFKRVAGWHPLHRAQKVMHLRVAVGGCHACYYGALFFENHHLYVLMGAPLMILTIVTLFLSGNGGGE